MRGSTVCFLLLMLCAMACVALAFSTDPNSELRLLFVLLALIFVGASFTSLALSPQSEMNGASRRRWFRPLVYAACAVVALQALSWATNTVLDVTSRECSMAIFDSWTDPRPDCSFAHEFSALAMGVTWIFGGMALAAILPMLLGVSIWDAYRMSRRPRAQTAREL